MRDREIVAAIVAGDPAGLAAAYDSYAAALHAYCRSLLAESADAADAVQDTFIIAAAKLGGLREPDRLRPWLYAVARNECHRRLRARRGTVGLDEAAEMTDTSAEVGAYAERAELRDLVRSAVAGLNPGDREIIELNLRHDLDGADLADALGVQLNQAYALQSRARGQLERSLGALLVARSGRESCPELAAMLDGWDGGLTVLLRKRVSRHIERCETCGARKRRELNPAALLSLLPVAILPPALREHVLRLVADVSPDAGAYRDHVARRAGPFRASGFPAPVAPVVQSGAGMRRILAATMAAAASGALIVGGLVLAGVLRHSAPAASTIPGAAAHASPPPSASPVSPAAPVSPPGTSPSAVSTVQAVVPPPAGTSPATPGRTRSPVPARTPTPTPTPTPARTPTTSPSPTPTPTPTVTQGTLSASPDVVQLTVPVTGGEPTGTFTLTASGGPVAAFTITAPAGLTVTPASGSLAAGQREQIVVTASGDGPAPQSALTIDPGGLTVTVVLPQPG
jgi:RNA polymerase sigma factor (sigma-70 family)